jgi:peptidoglycan/xylan/chitin deacetylase (PgdA/CDA1 family)
LDQYGWKATFFHVADNVRKYPALYQEVLKKGHRVGNHTYSHLKGFNCTTDEYVTNVQQATGLIKSNLFRPPYGRIRSNQILALKKDFNIIMWDVITHDYSSRNDADKIMKTLRRYLRPGSIVVFHDSVKAQKNVLEALPRAIEYWQQKGYTYGLL